MENKKSPQGEQSSIDEFYFKEPGKEVEEFLQSFLEDEEINYPGNRHQESFVKTDL